MKLWVVILAVLLPLYLSGCASVKDVSVRSIEDLKPQNGVVLVSATRTYQPSVAKHFIPGTLVSRFRFVDVATGAGFDILSEGLLVKKSQVVAFSHDKASRDDETPVSVDEEDQTGQLLVLQVPAGKYRLESWGLAADVGLNIGNIKSDPTQLPAMTFKVDPGKVTYLGNFHLKVLRDGRFLGVAMPSDAKLVCPDRAERDIMALRDNRPEIGKLRVLNQRCAVN